MIRGLLPILTTVSLAALLCLRGAGRVPIPGPDHTAANLGELHVQRRGLTDDA
jgi:hypothetical protein